MVSHSNRTHMQLLHETRWTPNQWPHSVMTSGVRLGKSDTRPGEYVTFLVIQDQDGTEGNVQSHYHSTLGAACREYDQRVEQEIQSATR